MYRFFVLGCIICNFVISAASAQSLLNLKLSKISPSLLDVRIDYVFRQRLKNEIKGNLVVVFTNPSDVDKQAATAAFLAKAFAYQCKLDVVTVGLLRDDLQSQQITRRSPLIYALLGEAWFDPKQIIFNKPFDIEVATALMTSREIEIDRSLKDKIDKYTHLTNDAALASAKAEKDIRKIYNLPKDWHLSLGNSFKWINGYDIEIPETEITNKNSRELIASTCDGFN